MAENAIPRGIEVLVKKASVDPDFKALLLAKRAGAAAEIGLELDPAESSMLNGIPASLLEGIIARTVVSPISRAAFLGKAAAVMLAALSTDLRAAEGPPPPGGIAPDRPARRQRFILYSETNLKGEQSYGLADQAEYDEKAAIVLKTNRVLRQAYLAASQAWAQDEARKGIPFPMKMPQPLVLNRIATYNDQDRADEMLKRRQEEVARKLEAAQEAEERRLAGLSAEGRAKEAEKAALLKAAEALFDKELKRLLSAPATPPVTRGISPDRPPAATGVRPY